MLIDAFLGMQEILAWTAYGQNNLSDIFRRPWNCCWTAVTAPDRACLVSKLLVLHYPEPRFSITSTMMSTFPGDHASHPQAGSKESYLLAAVQGKIIFGKQHI